jgi:hypothetical protein
MIVWVNLSGRAASMPHKNFSRRTLAFRRDD